jgi:hypothetical protein
MKMKKAVFTVIVAILAAAFFMVGNSFAEDREQAAQEKIIEIEGDCDIAGTGIINGVVTDACNGAPLSGVYVYTNMGTSTQTNQGIYVMLVPSGTGTIYFQKAGYVPSISGFQMCSGTSQQINRSLTRTTACPKTTSTTSVSGCK